MMVSATSFAQAQETLHADPLPSYTHCPDNNHPHMIDMGFYSGTKWACCNVDANNPEDHGGYYAWGETEEKTVYNHVTYKYCTGYDIDGDGWYDEEWHTVDWESIGQSICDTDYDVAHVKWGWRGSWQMPSEGQLTELKNYCTFQWTTYNGTYGCLLTSKKNGATIFLPASGYRRGSEIKENGECIDYCSGEHGRQRIFPSDDVATVLYSVVNLDGSSSINVSGLSRCTGYSVRPVANSESVMDLVLSSTWPININPGKDQIIRIISGNGSFNVKSSATDVATAFIKDGSIVVHAKSVGVSIITVLDNFTGQKASIEVNVYDHLLPSFINCPDMNHPHLIDLGLPSGTKWACCNVGASTPEGYGSYYAWGETEEKEETEDNSTSNAKGKSNPKGSTICGTGFDVAQEKWGLFWQLPSHEQFEELFRYKGCKREWISISDRIEGIRITGPSGGSIFLPSAGKRPITNFINNTDYGYYWSGSCRDGYGPYALEISNKYESLVRIDYHYSSYNYTVRPVAKRIKIAEAVDIGLSVKWASWNIGAETPEGIGDVYAWGELSCKDENSLLPYRFYDGRYTKYGIADNKYRLDLEDDVAHQLWGDKWRMPTYEELKELKEKCSITSVKKNGVSGIKVVGPNGNDIFIPCYYSDNSFRYNEKIGYYWSGELKEDNSAFYFRPVWYPQTTCWDPIDLLWRQRDLGHTIRPVFGDNIDDIKDDNTDVMSILHESQSSPVIYNLSGQRLKTPVKGINIVNGKKVLIR